MRVYELARDLGLDSKVVLEQAQALGLDVKTASSGLDDESAELLRLAIAGDEPAARCWKPRPSPQKRSRSPRPRSPGRACLSEGGCLGRRVRRVPRCALERDREDPPAPGHAGRVPGSQCRPNLMEEIAESYGFIVDVEETAPRAGSRRATGARRQSRRAEAAATGGDRHGPRRPRQDHPSRHDPQDQRRGRGAGWDHPAHRRLSGRGQRAPGDVHRHPGPRGFHRTAGPRGQHHRHRGPGGRRQRRCHAADASRPSPMPGRPGSRSWSRSTRSTCPAPIRPGCGRS